MKKADYDNDSELKVNYTPKFPSDSSDFVAVGAWKDEMVGYLCEKGLYATALNGKAPRYPGYVHTEKEPGPLAILKAGVDSEYNTKVHGIMLQSVKGVSPSLYKTLLNPPYLVNASGDGKESFDFLCEKANGGGLSSALSYENKREKFLKKPISRYCTGEEWDNKTNMFDSINLGCESPHTGQALVLDYIKLFPTELRSGNLATIKSTLRADKALNDGVKAKASLRSLIVDDLNDHEMAEEERAMAAQEDRIRELEEQLANVSQAGGGGGRMPSTNFEKRSVKDMSDPERLALLKAMDECSVCKDKHFGGKGPGRCLADPSVPLPSNFEQMVRPRRRAKIYRLRGNIEKAVAIEKTIRANAVETEELITLDTLEEMEGDASADHVRGEDCED